MHQQKRTERRQQNIIIGRLMRVFLVDLFVPHVAAAAAVRSAPPRRNVGLDVAIAAAGIADLSGFLSSASAFLELLEFLVAEITDPLGLFVVWHRGLLGRAVCAEDLAAVPAVVLAVRQGELAAAGVAVGRLSVVSPLSPRLLHQFHLKGEKDGLG